MAADIFEFWSRMKYGDRIHPADKDVLARLKPEQHGFRLNCLPASFGGRLRDAPIVLLYLSPGFGKQDIVDARTKEGRDHYFRRYKGYEPARALGGVLAHPGSRVGLSASGPLTRSRTRSRT